MSISRELYAVMGVLEVSSAAKPPQAAPSPTAPAPEQPSHNVLSAPKTPPPSPQAPPPNTAVRPSIATPANLNLLLDIELDARLRFGQCEMILREILELRPGSVVELNREILEPAELLVAGRVIARGDVVIVDGTYGLRITDIAQPEQRLKSVQT
jgi:flagellar motor switch protein FliN/FliY